VIENAESKDWMGWVDYWSWLRIGRTKVVIRLLIIVDVTGDSRHEPIIKDRRQKAKPVLQANTDFGIRETQIY